MRVAGHFAVREVTSPSGVASRAFGIAATDRSEYVVWRMMLFGHVRSSTLLLASGERRLLYLIDGRDDARGNALRQLLCHRE